MSSLRTANLIGAGMAMGVFTADVGATPRDALDPFAWLVYAVVALAGAFCAASVVLAWRHARQSPRWLWATLAGLLLLSIPSVSSFIDEGREMRRFLATADATRGIVADKYVRGPVHLVVEYQAAGRSYQVISRGPSPMVGTPAFSRWNRGDSIPVHYQPTEPRSVLVGDRAPDRRLLLESLAKTWIAWGVLLTAYLPLVVRGLRREFLALHTRWRSGRRRTAPA